MVGKAAAAQRDVRLRATEFVELPLFGSAATAVTPSGNGASPEPLPPDREGVTHEPLAVTPAARDGDDGEEATSEDAPLTDGEQLRLL